jgi:hypothetical protein
VTKTSASIPTVVFNGYFQPNAANAGVSGLNFDLVYVADTGSSPNGFVTLQLQNGQCGGSGYGVVLEANPGGTTTRSSCIALTPGNTYQYSYLFDEVGGTAELAVYNAGTCTQVGSTVTVAQITGNDIAIARWGNAEAGTSTGSNVFQNPMVDWTNHTFPNCP